MTNDLLFEISASEVCQIASFRYLAFSRIQGSGFGISVTLKTRRFKYTKYTEVCNRLACLFVDRYNFQSLNAPSEDIIIALPQIKIIAAFLLILELKIELPEF